ncbi:MAG: hypothetical protein FJ100_09135 [Deltaproteobacteria bacterium]|nr:hypothetical protein [Deltaproteobacteria bacterium]
MSSEAGAGPDEIALDKSFQNSLGRTPAERIALWQDWLRRFPDSPHATSVRREVDAMREQSANMRTARQDAARLSKMTAVSRRIYHDQPDNLRVQEAAWLVFSAADWSHVADLRIHLRPKGKQTYQLARPEASGPLHRRLRVPQALVAEPGFEYFAELAPVDSGETTLLVGSPRSPAAVFVSDPFAEVGRRPVDASTFRMVGEFVDFNRGRGDDQFLYAEVAVGYRLQDPKLLYAFEMGYGLLTGVGGAVAPGPVLDPDNKKVTHTSGPRKGKEIAKDDTLDPRRSAFKYGYLQTEWALHASFHGITRLVVGLGKDGIDTGLELMGRIGPERGTNLRLGVATLADTGRAGSVALTTHVVENLPIQGIFEVTNRPVGEDIGVRLIARPTTSSTNTLG